MATHLSPSSFTTGLSGTDEVTLIFMTGVGGGAPGPSTHTPRTAVGAGHIGVGNMQVQAMSTELVQPHKVLPLGPCAL